MRNLKRALSLGLTAAMISGLMVMGSSAASYADVTSEDNQEAIEVLQAVEIMVGDENGDFNPDQNVTRNEMAVIMANLMEYNVASYKNTSPFTDVPAWAEPYVAACWTNGITAGYSDTIYGGSDTVTTAQAALMLMKALGYFQYASDFGSDWQLATTRQGNAIDLFNGVDSGVTQAMTRNDVAQLVLNTLRSGTVEASTDGSWTIGDVTINNNVRYSYITSNQPYAVAISDDRSTDSTTDAGRSIVELGEQLYMGDLQLNDKTSDDFERPSRTWTYDGAEIGTYMKDELIVATYTDGVTGRELYDLLTSSTIREYSLEAYLNGSQVIQEGRDVIEKNDLVRSNNNELLQTGDGVLTQVFMDLNDKEITITSIDTWLAKSNSAYNTNSETLSVRIYDEATNGSEGHTEVLDLDEIPAIEDVAADQFLLVNRTLKDRNDYETVAIADPEILTGTTITKFSNREDSDVVSSLFDSLTADGTSYDSAMMALYNEDVLDLYDQDLLTDMTYNVILDQYGYAIGVELDEGSLNYVFITGYDRNGSHIAINTADAAAIFTDGTMDVISVNVSNTNKNLDRNNDGDVDEAYVEKYDLWTSSGDGEHQVNRWYTYTVTESGVYTLKPVNSDEMLVTDYDNVTDNDPEVINCSNVWVRDYEGDADDLSGDGTNLTTNNRRAYGNDDSVYITVEAGDVDLDNNVDDSAITDVTGVYTGVQDVDIEMSPSTKLQVPQYIYSLVDDDQYIIASIVLGEAQGSVENYAVILDAPTSEERLSDGTYVWTFDAIMGGEKVEMTARSEYQDVITDLDWAAVTTDVTGVYTGVQDVDIEMSPSTKLQVPQYIYSLVDDDQYIIASIVLGEAQGSVENYAVILDAPTSEERLSDGTYVWTFDAIMGGEKVEMTARSEYQDVITDLDWAAVTKEVMELRMDADGYVTGAEPVDPDKVANFGNADDGMEDFEVFDQTFTVADMPTLEMNGRTMQIRDGSGLTFITDAPTVLWQRINNKGTYTAYSSVQDAYNDLADENENAAGLQFRGRIVAVLNSQGVAEWAYIESLTPVNSSDPGYGDNGSRTENGNAALVVYDGYTAEYVYADGNGRAVFTFGVPTTWNGSRVDYTVTAYVNGDRVYRDYNAYGTANGGEVDGQINNLVYNRNDSVVIYVNDITRYVAPVTVPVDNDVAGTTTQFTAPDNAPVNDNGNLNLVPGNTVTLTITGSPVAPASIGAETVNTFVVGQQYVVYINGVEQAPVTCTVANQLTVTYTYVGNETEIAVTDIREYTEDPQPGEPIAAVSVTGVTAPSEVGDALGTPVSGTTGVTVENAAWSSGTAAVAGNNTLTFTIAAAEGYNLADSVTVTVAGQTATATKADGYKVTVTFNVKDEPSIDETVENAPKFIAEKDYDKNTGAFTLRVPADMGTAEKREYVKKTLNDSGLLPEGVTVNEVIPNGAGYDLYDENNEKIDEVSVTTKIVYSISLGGKIIAYALESGNTGTISADVTGYEAGDLFIAEGESAADTNLPKIGAFGDKLEISATYADSVGTGGVDVVLQPAVSVTTSLDNPQYQKADGIYANFTSGQYVAVGTSMKVTGSDTDKTAARTLMNGKVAVEAAQTVGDDGKVTYTFTAGSEDMTLTESVGYTMTIAGQTVPFTVSGTTVTFSVAGEWAEEAPLAGLYLVNTEDDAVVKTSASTKTVLGTYAPATGWTYTFTLTSSLAEIQGTNGQIVLEKAVEVTLGDDNGSDCYFSAIRLGLEDIAVASDKKFYVKVGSAIQAVPDNDVYKAGTLAASYTDDGKPVIEPVSSIGEGLWGQTVTLVYAIANKDGKLEAMETAKLAAFGSITDFAGSAAYTVRGEEVKAADIADTRVKAGDKVVVTYTLSGETTVNNAGATTAGKLTLGKTGATIDSIVCSVAGATANTEAGTLTFATTVEKVPANTTVTITYTVTDDTFDYAGSSFVVGTNA